MPNRIEIITKTDCPYCDKAKEYLFMHGLPFEAVLMDDKGQREAFYDAEGLEGRSRTVPQVFLVDVEDDQRLRLGGYSALVAQNLASLKSEIVA